jgi:hypothetical protein
MYIQTSCTQRLCKNDLALRYYRQLQFTSGAFHSIHIFIYSKTELNDQGELEHRRVKCFYPRMNKVGFTRQIAKHQWRERLLLHNHSKSSAHQNNTTATIGFQESDPLPYMPPTIHHHISNLNRYHDNLTAWLGAHSGDPALMVCNLFNCSTSTPETM